MKKSFIFSLILIFSVFISFSQSIDTSNDFFSGKWNVLTKGTPQGDAQMILELERIDGKFQGRLGSGQNDSIEWNKLTKVIEGENNITINFIGAGYDVHIFLKKVDENKAHGYLMDVYETVATRQIKE